MNHACTAGPFGCQYDDYGRFEALCADTFGGVLIRAETKIMTITARGWRMLEPSCPGQGITADREQIGSRHKLT